jgi:hypothetical protein
MYGSEMSREPGAIQADDEIIDGHMLEIGRSRQRQDNLLILGFHE